MQNESTKNFSMKMLEPAARSDADLIRAQKEAAQMEMPDGRKRRRNNRREQIAIKTTADIKRLVHAMAEAEGKDYVEIIEDAIKLRDRMMKGKL